ncbi:hypothetical protein [Solicola gregarius]|uniref:Uncharacterized protein n=1 Tax=Solicola gregarius TaxID=2908642 RepID=A0AA46YIT0_9ACTN|nr:hypothetical protein [Solicola gregarius]UYM03480.1 hypothetical protein L0C25_13025 [Solicola gregarius]
MRDDFQDLRRSLESGVVPPSFDAVSRRAEATVRRRRTRAVVGATCGGVTAIVLAAVAVTTLPGDESEPDETPVASDTAGPPPGVEVMGGLPSPLIEIDTSAGPDDATAIGLAPEIVNPADRIFIEIAALDGSTTAGIDLVANDGGWTVAPGRQRCAGAQVADAGTITLPNDCVPQPLTIDSRWTMTVETNGGDKGQIFTAQVEKDGHSDGKVYPAKQWPTGDGVGG